MIQRHAEEVFRSQWIRTGFLNRGSRALVGSRGSRDNGCNWLLLAADMAGLTTVGWRTALDPADERLAGLPGIATRTISPDAGSVRAAREFTVATVRRWGAAERCYDIAVVVSELLTNALQHARPRRIQLGLLHQGSRLLCAVADPGRAIPVPKAPSSLAECGRGLQMVAALCDQWGYSTPNDTGKVVWAMFAPPAHEAHHTEALRRAADRSRLLEIQSCTQARSSWGSTARPPRCGRCRRPPACSARARR
jgi:anti-sigma regulatory factor (Ser/Thr protein kinase)